MKNPNRVAAGQKLAARRTAKSCPHCGADFSGTVRQIYCSRKCKEAAVATKAAVACKWCGQPVPNQGPGRPRLYCSARCKTRILAGTAPEAVATNRRCAYCGDEYTIRGVRGWKRLYCSEGCRTRADSVAANARRNGTLDDQAAALNTEINRRRS